MQLSLLYRTSDYEGRAQYRSGKIRAMGEETSLGDPGRRVCVCVGVHLGVPKFIAWETGLMGKSHQREGKKKI